MPPSNPNHVIVHPLVLLSVVDHYNRVAKDTNKRVVGVLLGEVWKGRVDVTNSYAVPFEEDEKNPSIWFFDHLFHEQMFAMHKKVNVREQIVGWYSTGPKIRSNDLDIHELMRRYCPCPSFVIVDVNPKDIGIPTDAYVMVEELLEEKSEPKKTFGHISSSIGALEAEEVGVEHLLRDVKDLGSSDSLATRIDDKITGFRALLDKLSSVSRYLQLVAENKLPVNHGIMYELQNIFNLLPGAGGLALHETAAAAAAVSAMSVDDDASSSVASSIAAAGKAQESLLTANAANSEQRAAFSSQTNDLMLNMYLSSMIRSVLQLHTLINNKLSLSHKEKQADAPKKEEKKEEKKDEKAVANGKK